jgi:hypothetical protein
MVDRLFKFGDNGVMTNKNTLIAAATELILNTDLDIDQAAEAFSNAFPNESMEILAEVFVEVVETLPELN